MAIHYLDEDRKAYGFRKAAGKMWLKGVVEAEGKKTGTIGIIFCSDDYLLDINKRFLQRDYFTDVISFTYSEGREVSGDILISVDRVEENAAQLGISFPDEIRRIMVHGVLHLIGYDDLNPKEKARMSELEDVYLARARELGV